MCFRLIELLVLLYVVVHLVRKVGRRLSISTVSNNLLACPWLLQYSLLGRYSGIVAFILATGLIKALSAKVSEGITGAALNPMPTLNPLSPIPYYPKALNPIA